MGLTTATRVPDIFYLLSVWSMAVFFLYILSDVGKSSLS